MRGPELLGLGLKLELLGLKLRGRPILHRL
jgi:hypothetical protein